MSYFKIMVEMALVKSSIKTYFSSPLFAAPPHGHLGFHNHRAPYERAFLCGRTLWILWPEELNTLKSFNVTSLGWQKVVCAVYCFAACVKSWVGSHRFVWCVHGRRYLQCSALQVKHQSRIYVSSTIQGLSRWLLMVPCTVAPQVTTAPVNQNLA